MSESEVPVGELAQYQDQEPEIDNATAQAATTDFDIGSDEELSDLDEEQFKDFDETQINASAQGVYNLPSFKRKKSATEGSERIRKTREKAPSRRRRRGSSGSEGGGRRGDIQSDDDTINNKDLRPTDPAEAGKWDLDRQMDTALKPQRKKVRPGEIDLDAMQDEEVVQLRDRMRDAAEKDKEANVDKKVATHKLRMLPEVEGVLRKSSLYGAILDNNLLGSIRAWLEPLPDKSLPALNIQRVLFGVLGKLPIETEHLRESGVGKVVLFYKKSKKPEELIKIQAERLIAEWSRPIIKKSADYKSREIISATYDPDDRPLVMRRSANVVPSDPKMRTAVPRQLNSAYEIAPMVDPNRIMSNARFRTPAEDPYKKLKQRLKSMTGKKGPVSKGGVSIEGRGLN